MRLLPFLLVLAAWPLRAQEAAAPDPLVAQHRLAAILREATADYARGDYQGAVAKLDTVDGPAAGDLGVLNLRAAALTKAGDYGQAAEIFAAIVRANPAYFPAAFNAGEVQFLSGDREGALETFRRLRQRDPGNELLRFKVFLCQHVLGRREEAAKTASAMHSAGSTPAWYYAQALLARSAGDEGRARKNLRAARSLYGEDGCRLFDESVASAGP
ncbi:MAG: tetratricopeptide repeat protein [Chthoniobacterales bacterium]|jgi:tetratricopeptide (TPR) repeat protein